MESNLVCKVINKIQWLKRGNNYDYLPITSVIMDRIGLHKVLLPIDHKHYNFWEKKKHLGQTSLVKCLIKSKSFSIFGNFPDVGGCCYSYCDQFCVWWI